MFWGHNDGLGRGTTVFLEIKTFGLVSTILSFLASSTINFIELVCSDLDCCIAQIWLDLLRGFWCCWTTFCNFSFFKFRSFMILHLLSRCVPLTAFLTSMNKNNFVHKVFEQVHWMTIYWCMVCLWSCVFQDWISVKTLIRLIPLDSSNVLKRIKL